MRFVVAGPLDSTEFFQPAIAHPGMHRTQSAHFVPDSFGARRSPFMAEAAGQLVDDVDIIAHARRRRYDEAHPLYAALARRDGAFAFTPARGCRQHYVSERGGIGVEEVLYHQEFEPSKQLQRAVTIGLRIRS